MCAHRDVCKNNIVNNVVSSPLQGHNREIRSYGIPFSGCIVKRVLFILCCEFEYELYFNTI